MSQLRCTLTPSFVIKALSRYMAKAMCHSLLLPLLSKLLAGTWPKQCGIPCYLHGDVTCSGIRPKLCSVLGHSSVRLLSVVADGHSFLSACLSPCHFLTLPPCHFLTLPPCHLSPYYLVTLSPVTLSPFVLLVALACLCMSQHSEAHSWS